MANILYRKQKQQKSLDNGITWIDTGEYRVGAVLENPSNCASADSRQCRWVDLPESEGYYCDGYSKYTMQVEECTENGLIWTRTGEVKQGSTFVESDSLDCGYEENVTPNDTISFSWTGSSNTFKLNNTTYQATSTSYTATLDDLNITSLTSCKEVFANIGLTNLYNFPDTSNVTDFQSMFNNCIAVTSLDLSKFDTSSATQMQAMFYYCVKLTSLDLSSFDTSNVYNLSSIFYGCKKLQTLDVSSWDVNHITNSNFYRNMFTDCDSLTTLKVKEGTYDWWCARLQEAGLSCNVIDSNGGGSTTGSTTGGTSGDIIINDFIYSGTSSIFDSVDDCYDGSSYFNNKYSNIPISGTSGVYIVCDVYGSEVETMIDNCITHQEGFTNPYIRNILESECYKNSFYSSKGMFTGIFCGEFLRIYNIPDTSNVTNMSQMFLGCSLLTELNVLHNMNTENVTDMSYMFRLCYNLTSLNLTSFNTSKVTDMSYMFSECKSLETLDVSTWSISKVSSRSGMFLGCSQLREIKVKSGTYSWWYDRLTNSKIQGQVTIIEI